MGSISGTVHDSTGLVIPGVTVKAASAVQGIAREIITDATGLYSFPALPPGEYSLRFETRGFRAEERTGVVVQADTPLQLNVTLQVLDQREEVTVSEAATLVAVEVDDTEVGGTITGQQMAAIGLNGRSYTDLLALNAGIAPQSTQTPDSIVMAGASVAIAPSGGLNPGNQSISGQREDSNGFLLNGGDVKELMNGGTSIIPDLDSVAEVRVLTGNFDARYGNYGGGVVSVVTKSGTNNLHGSAFEYLRNTDLDARGFFSPDRSFYRQNQFGGTVGGPIVRDKVFFFADYQGTRNDQGIETGLIAVPSAADRSGNFADQAASLGGSVSGPYLARLLSQKLGYSVAANEAYYTPGCVVNTQCVFPNALIPQRAWSAPARNLLRYIPQPDLGPSTFSTSAAGQTLRDDKGSFRVDGNSSRWGTLSAYYYADDYGEDNPYPTGQGGASVPGFNALTLGRGQLVSLSDTRTFGPATVNELHLSYMRDSNNLGQPAGGVGPSLASQGFVTGPGTPGIVPLAPSIEGVENVVLNSFVMGTPITNLKQANNTFGGGDNFSRVIGPHTFMAGLQASFEQVNVNPNPTFNGSFLFSGSETGSDFADFLIGVASNYTQADSQAYYARHKYVGGFAQDSWHLTSNLTLNYGLRWDLMQYWSEKYNQVPTFIPGEQSVVYPGAPVGLVYVGDRGVPNTLVPESNRFSPRLGLAWSPSASDGLLGKILGGPAKTSVRAGYGIFYSIVQGNIIAFDEPQPPYGLSYTSPGEPLFATPFITASNGQFNGNPFPLTFPPLNASPAHPNAGISFSQFEPLAGMTAPPPWNTYPYTESYFLSLERQVHENTLVSIGYVGSQAHHLPVVYSANPGNPALCLALSHPSAVAAGTPVCGPFGEDTQYVTASGQVVHGTREGLGPAYANDDYDATIGNSNYNSLQATVRHTAKSLSLMAAYTFSKSIDQASSLSDPVNPFNFAATRALSAFDLEHDLVLSYDYQLPLDRLFAGRAKGVTGGWSLSGITRISSGFPVTLKSTGDNSLMGSIPNGVNNYSLDLPDYNGAPLQLNSNPASGRPYFNTAAFSINALGTPGDASRRSFFGPGGFNSDIALLKTVSLREPASLQIRLETFNTFNHPQFFGPAAVNGNIDSPLFGEIVNAAPPRLMQAAIRLTF